jgi:hypothetical protein
MMTYESLLDRDLEWALREGSMHFEGESAVHKALRRIAARLEELGVDYAIAGGMALFFHGYRRFTEDVDVLITPEGLAKVHDELEGRGYVRPFEKSKNLRDAENRVRIDFIVTGQYPGSGKPGPVAFPDPKGVAEVRDGVRIVSLPALLQLKLASGKEPSRRKDLGDAQELLKLFALPHSFRDNVDPSLRELYDQLWSEIQSARADE